MKKKLLIVLIVIIAVLGTLLGVHLYNSSKQSDEMEKYRVYMNKKYIPLTNKTNTHLDNAQNAVWITSWYNYEDGFLDNIDLIYKWADRKDELINMDAKYEDTQALKKNLLNNISTYESSLKTIDLHADDEDDSELKKMLETDTLIIKEQYKEIKKIIQKYYEYK